MTGIPAAVLAVPDVVVHGDVHQWNALRSRMASGGRQMLEVADRVAP